MHKKWYKGISSHLFLTSLLALSVSVTSHAFEPDEEEAGYFGNFTSKRWVEASVPVPANPVEENLVQIEIYEMPRYKYFIDLHSVHVSAGDNVARYTVVVEPPSGLRNVFFEGIRCDKKQSRIYASSLWREPLKKTEFSTWQPILERGVTAYRYDLFRYFLCSNSVINGKKRDIAQLLKYPSGNTEEDEERD